MAGINAAARAVGGRGERGGDRARPGGRHLPDTRLHPEQGAHPQRRDRPRGARLRPRTAWPWTGSRSTWARWPTACRGSSTRARTGARAYLESLPGLRLVMGEARFEEPGVVSVGGERISAPRVLVATGAAPAAPPIPGLAQTPHFTSTDALALREVPGRLLVIGAGPIGLELGQALSRLGSRVTLIDVAPRLLMQADPEAGEALAGLLGEEGIELVMDARIERVGSRPGGGPRITVTWQGATRELDGDAILLGRRARPPTWRRCGPRGRDRGEPQGHPGGCPAARPRSPATSPPATFSGRPTARSRTPPGSSAATPPTTPSASTRTTRTRTSGPLGGLHRPRVRDGRDDRAEGARGRSRRRRRHLSASRAARPAPGGRSAAW